MRTTGCGRRLHGRRRIWGGGLYETPDAETEAALYAESVTSDLGLQAVPESQESKLVLSTEERGTLRAIRRLVAATAKSCNQPQEYLVQLDILDHLLHGDVPAATVPGIPPPVSPP